jgi:transcriptional regulator
LTDHHDRERERASGKECALHAPLEDENVDSQPVGFHLLYKWRWCMFSTMSPSGETPRLELLPGTLDLIVLRTLTTIGAQHAYGIAARLEQIAEQPFTLNQGTLYPALVRLEQRGWIKGTWQTTESNREAKYYAITRAGTRALADQIDRWKRSAGLVNRLLMDEAE